MRLNGKINDTVLREGIWVKRYRKELYGNTNKFKKEKTPTFLWTPK